MTRQRPRVLLVEDLVVMRQGFALCHPTLDVVGTYDSTEELLESGPPEADLIILDLQLRTPDGSQHQGTEAVENVAGLGIPICLYTSESRRLVLARCLRAGAHGVVHKQEPLEEATRAFHAVAAGATCVSGFLLGLAELLERSGDLPDLSPRQRQVLAARARGEKWDSIARRLYITPSVAREHMDAVNRKLADHLQSASPADLERALGLAPGDLLDTASHLQ
ncbi:response regulator [Aestuariimicrobium sp. p3-SID1156]|uniref:response regulator n=1 Tax=Aestuariimicrobium sp. p3-SID1156 TaxID=2916038 RepID=UPI00223A7305|nr:response regulator [Aestuariimicrobium sp. p3-SID1156]MCT1460280.1 response regulator [Aestuariimicrobium sp. p3-SID1156]